MGQVRIQPGPRAVHEHEKRLEQEAESRVQACDVGFCVSRFVFPSVLCTQHFLHEGWMHCACSRDFEARWTQNVGQSPVSHVR